jgi:AraC-like DNA-binding protein
MKLSNNIFDVIILLGAIQGFIISALLYFKKEKLTANKILAVFILLISLACLNIYLMEIGVQNNSTFWTIVGLVVPFVIVMPLGPLIYFYVQCCIFPDFKLDRHHRTHFYPVLLDLIPSLIGIAFVSGALLNWIPKSTFPVWSSFLDDYNTCIDIPRLISVTIYTWFAWKRLVLFERTEPDKLIAWPKQFILVLATFEMIWLLHLIPYVIPFTSAALLNWVGWYPLYIPLAIMVYWLGIKGYLISRPERIKISRIATLTSATVKEMILTLEKAMSQDLIFLNPTLSLNEVVKHTGIPQKNVSAVLNQHLGKSFNEFVNEYRINEVKKRLLETGNEHLTITGIAFECGFNSQATFQRTFKQFTNQSPREFQLAYQKNQIKSSQI